MIGFSLFFQIVEMVIFALNHNEVTLASVLHLFVDCCACFWISWMILDGLEWRTYVYIFIFCM